MSEGETIVPEKVDMTSTSQVVKLENTGEIELPPFDVTQYIGRKAKILTIEERKGKFGYYVFLATEVLETLNDGTEITATKILGLQQDLEEKIGWTKTSKTGRFLQEKGVKHYKELAGIEVIVQATEPNKEGKRYLTF